MADINQVITLGIGTPGAIPEFLTFGLQIGELTVPGQPGIEYTMSESRLQYTLPISRLDFTFREED